MTIPAKPFDEPAIKHVNVQIQHPIAMEGWKSTRLPTVGNIATTDPMIEEVL